MGLERLLVGAFAIGLVAGCGGSTSGDDRDDGGCRVECSRDVGGRENSESKGDMNQGNNSDDCCYDLFDGGDGGKTDGDAGNGMNRPPTLRMVYEESHPLAGDEYAERNVRRMRNTPLIGLTGDPDGDTVDCRFESGGILRDWNPDCRYMYNSDTPGEYFVDVRTRDSRGLEGETSTISLRVMNNIPPVANAGPDFELSTFVPACVVFGPCPAPSSCSDGPYVPGHPSLDSYDEDGVIESYEIFPDYVNFPESRYENACAGLTYSSPGERTLRLRIIDDEGLQDTDDATVNVVSD